MRFKVNKKYMRNFINKFKISITAILVSFFCCFEVSAADSAVFYSDGPKDKNEVALTFDDGPGLYTEKILDILKRYNIKATFFMEGSQVEFRQAIARKVLTAGHEIGSHLYSHPDFYHYKKPDAKDLFIREIDKSEKILEKVTGKRPKLMRMPNGYVRAPWVKEIAKEKNYILVNWTFGCDWKKMTSKQLADIYIKNICPGCIFLMHDGGKNRQSTAEALPLLIEELQKKGYKIVTVSELLGLN